MAFQQKLLILTLFSSSLQLSFCFSSSFKNSGDFGLRLITVLESIGIETSKGFRHLRVRIQQVGQGL
jgi:hypothetical protein